MSALPKNHYWWDKRWIEQHLEPFPHAMADFLAKEYSRVYETKSRRDANLLLLDTHEKCTPRKLKLAADEDAIRAKAQALAHQCERVAATQSVQRTFRFFQTITVKNSVDLPNAKNLPGIAGRLGDPIWWRRQLRKSTGREVENVARQLGMTHKKAGIYVSNDTLNRRKKQRSRNRAMLEAMVAVNELDQKYTLQELVELSVSNPKLKRAELMTRLAGFELIANKAGHKGLFITITCPSRFHSYHVTGEKNEKWDGSTPRDGALYLAKVWARIRADFARAGIRPYGIRVAEPHHDATPHWHMVLYHAPNRRREIVDICRKHALHESPEEKGACDHRIEAIPSDPKQGTATGYIAKYVAKMIDGYGLEKDLYGTDINDAIARVDAWSSLWSIRQFQQIGGAPVTVWREARRLDAKTDEYKGVIGRIVKACNAGKGKWSQGWADFNHAMGGVAIPRKHQQAWLAKNGAIDTETGEVRINRYGEDAADQIIGIEDDWGAVRTRRHNWRIERGTEKRRKERRRRTDHNGGQSDQPTDGVEQSGDGRPRADRRGAVRNNGDQDHHGRSGRATDPREIEGRQTDSGDAFIDNAPAQPGHFGRAQPAPPWSPVYNCTDTDPKVFKFFDGITPLRVRFEQTEAEKRPKVTRLQATIELIRRKAMRRRH